MDRAETKYGLHQEQLNSIIELISEVNTVDMIVIFGSRAKGNFKHGSDIDLALYGDKIDTNTLLELLINIDSLELPYKTDLVIYNRISNLELKQHIDRVGDVLFDRKIESAT